MSKIVIYVILVFPSFQTTLVLTKPTFHPIFDVTLYNLFDYELMYLSYMYL